MKQARYLIAIVLAGLAIPVGIAQDSSHHSRKPPHYKLIDIGTFGGPQSYVFDGFGFTSAGILANKGTLTGWADTPVPDPFPNFCFNSDCFVSHAFRREESGELTDLGALPGGGSSATLWMSRNGMIAGLSENGQTDPLIPGFPEGRAVLWHNGEITDLGVLEGGYESQANAVNSRGEVVGLFTNTTPDPNSMYGSGYQTRAFFWQDDVMQDLGTLGTGTDAQALFINEGGQVVGWSYVSSVQINCLGALPDTLATGSFIWDKKNGMRNLGGLGGMCTNALALNGRGQVVGFSDLKGDLVERAFIWDGSIHDLRGSLGGKSTGAFALNDAGEAVGFADLAGDTTWHAALWRRIGKITDLGVLGNDQCSFAQSINARRQVVGISVADCVNNAGFRPFLWDDGSIFDLNALIPPGSPLQLQSADTINDHGEIAVSSVDANGNEHAVLLIPCDENHPGVDGCDYNLVDEAAATREKPAPTMQVPAGVIQSNSVRQMLRQRLGLRYHIPGPMSGARVISGPNVTLSPTSLTFSTQAIGTTSAAKTVTLKNTGTASLTISSIANTGTNAGDFSQATTCGASLAAGASCKISVKFKPTASGTRTAALSITDNAAGSPQKVPLSGVGTTAKLSPTSLSFGSVAVGTTSAAKTVTLANVGTTTLSITGIAIIGTNAGDFTQTHTCGSSLAAGARCTMNVFFSPSATGSQTGTLSVTDNAAGSPQPVSLSGVGVTSNYTLTGRCFIPVGRSCLNMSDPAQCPPGQPVIRLGVLPCSVSVDTARGCRTSGFCGATYSGGAGSGAAASGSLR